MIRLLLVLTLFGCKCKKERAPVPKTILGDYRVYCDGRYHHGAARGV